jgi:hypothetical protein
MQVDIAERVELDDSISIAMLVVLETLSPLERAVFVLREAFGFTYPRIGVIFTRSEAAVRQLSHRARNHVRARRPRFDTDPLTRAQLTERFLDACQRGDLTTLLAVLAPDVVFVGDSGGIGRAPRHPIHGADKVARFLLAIRAAPGPGPVGRTRQTQRQPSHRDQLEQPADDRVRPGRPRRPGAHHPRHRQPRQTPPPAHPMTASACSCVDLDPGPTGHHCCGAVDGHRHRGTDVAVDPRAVICDLEGVDRE